MSALPVVTSPWRLNSCLCHSGVGQTLIIRLLSIRDRERDQGKTFKEEKGKTQQFEKENFDRQIVGNLL